MGNNEDKRIRLITNHLKSKIIHSINKDGEVVLSEQVGVNNACRLVSMMKDPSAIIILDKIFSAPLPEEKRSRIDNPELSFENQWENLAKAVMNSEDFHPENNFGSLDERLMSIDPRNPPTPPWSGSELRALFVKLRGIFTKCNDCFRRSGHLEGGKLVDHGDHFLKCVVNIVTDEPKNFHLILLYAFYCWEGFIPPLMTRYKPSDLQFDTSEGAINKIESSGKKQRVDDSEDSVGIASAISSLKSSDEEIKMYTTQSERNVAEKRVLNEQERSMKIENLTKKYDQIKRMFDDPRDIHSEAVRDQMKKKMEEITLEMLNV